MKRVFLPASTTVLGDFTSLVVTPGVRALTDKAAEETATAAARADTKIFLVFIVNILLKINVNKPEQQYDTTSVTSLSTIMQGKYHQTFVNEIMQYCSTLDGYHNASS